MSGFFGIFNPKGTGINLEAFEQMKTAADRPGHDGIETYVDDHIALGHVMLRVSPESKYDQQPLKSDCGNYILVGHFRLDYRDELGDKLGLTQMELELTPDSVLAMMAYKKWKEKCVDHLEGDWAFVIYNKKSNSILLLKDIYGYSGLFFLQNDEKIYFSSSPYEFSKIKSLNLSLDLIQIKKLGKKHGGIDLCKTVVKELYSVMFGYGFFFQNENALQLILKKEYDFDKKLKYKHIQDIFHFFQLTVFQSIAERSKPLELGLFLSAGLDSSFIADTLHIFNQQKNRFVDTFTSFPPYKHMFDDSKLTRISEENHVRGFTESMHTIRPNFIDASDISFQYFIDTEKFKNFFNPIITPNSFWMEAVYKKASNNGVKQILNGQLGNYIVSWDSPGIALSYLLKFQFIEFIKYLYHLLPFYNNKLWVTIKQEVLKPAYISVRSSFFLIMDLKRNQKISNSDLKVQRVTYNSKTISYKSSKGLRKLIFQYTAPGVGIRGYLDGERFGIHNCDPYSDRRLVELSFGLSENIFNMRGKKKFLYWQIMKGKLSSEIESRRGSFPQSYDIGYRLANDQTLRNYIKSLDESNVDLSIIERPRIVDVESLLLGRYDIAKVVLSIKLLKNVSIFNLVKNFENIRR